MANQKLKVLVLSDFQGWDANVVRDYLYSFNRFSRHEFYYMHSWRENHCRRLHRFDFDRFDAIVFFWDCYWGDIDNETAGVDHWAISSVDFNQVPACGDPAATASPAGVPYNNYDDVNCP